MTMRMDTTVRMLETRTTRSRSIVLVLSILPL
jgi:hypothetical protein